MAGSKKSGYAKKSSSDKPKQRRRGMSNVGMIYCVKCKRHTGNKAVERVFITVKGVDKPCLKAGCSVCGIEKFRFI
jgi:hypothetical protein